MTESTGYIIQVAAKADEIAQATMVAIGESGWVNGHHLVVDGGYTLGCFLGWVDVDKAPAPKHTRGLNRRGINEEFLSSSSCSLLGPDSGAVLLL